MVTDDDGAEATANVTVKVGNRAPSAVVAGDASTVVGGLVRLDGRGSTDPDGKVVGRAVGPRAWGSGESIELMRSLMKK